ncbi:MAG TPA: hypothetical protein VGQ33_17880 [Vicinamibacteria bacterium]|nr:hypothetical protein [Vicinamibacteria bacterium]
MGVVLVASLLGALGACAGVLFTAPPGSTITLVANPPFVQSDGGVSVITAILIEPAGTAVSDGTDVQFFTDLGSIEPLGKTKNGVARVNFTSDSRSGVAHITALSGGGAPTVNVSPTDNPSPGTGGTGTGGTGGTGTASTTVTIGNVRVKQVLGMRADPPRIVGSNSTTVFARAVDENGNSIANVPIFFEVVTDPATEHFQDTGPVFTNNNGEASDLLKTNRVTAGTAMVHAYAIGAGAKITSDPLPIAIE